MSTRCKCGIWFDDIYEIQCSRCRGKNVLTKVGFKMNSTFREKVQDISNEAANLLKKNLSGKEKLEGGMFDRLIRLIGAGLKVEHMNQLSQQNDRSFGLRLLTFLPKDQDTRKKYIELTNPELRPLLSAKTEIKK